MGRQTKGVQVDGLANGHMYDWADRQTRQMDWRTDRQKDRQSERLTDRKSERLTERQKKLKTNRKAYKVKGLERD